MVRGLPRGFTADTSRYGRRMIDTDVVTLLRDGLVARRCLDEQWVECVRADIDTAFADAMRREGGAVPRGPHRWYVEVHPQQMRGFAALVSHPWFVAICTEVLGPRYEIVEVGFDIPFPGAADQPWHRDFPSCAETREQHRLTSLAFNATVVDVSADMGPMEFAPGTHWEPGTDWADGMFPPASAARGYESVAVRTFPTVGTVSARSALTVHRGTANRSSSSRPVLVVGVDSPGAGHGALHDLQVTPDFWAGLPPVVRDHLTGRVVDALEPVVQKHDIPGLLAPYGA